MTISLMRRGETRSLFANAVWLSANGSRKPSRRISPGVGLARNSRSVIVDNLDIERRSFRSNKTDSPLTIDAKRMLPRSARNTVHRKDHRHEAKRCSRSGRDDQNFGSNGRQDDERLDDADDLVERVG